MKRDAHNEGLFESPEISVLLRGRLGGHMTGYGDTTVKQF